VSRHYEARRRMRNKRKIGSDEKENKGKVEREVKISVQKTLHILSHVCIWAARALFVIILKTLQVQF
jgi:hypothetical protein